jgi:hypothetical protein
MIVLNTRQKAKLKAHPLLLEENHAFMQLHSCKYTHELIERVLINVAAKNNLKWIMLLKTLSYDEEQFVELCVAMILINKYLKLIFNIEKGEKLCLTGYEFGQVIEEYYRTQNIID